MTTGYHCFTCKKVLLLVDAVERCPSCGGTDAEVVSSERVKEGLEAGVFFGRATNDA
jgi:Zn finger protein HypA/HybF involved in hydrogenase expression